MKNWYSILFIMIPLFLFSCENKNKGNYIRVSKSNPHYFEYTNGELYIPTGLNICWERFEKEETAILNLYEQRFQKLKQNGGNYIRIWLSAPFFEVEQNKAGEYNKDVASRIDKLLELADRYDIKIKFCFENFRKLTGQPAPFSTSVPFDKPIYAADGILKSMDEFYTTEKGKELFLNRTRFFAKRYANNSSVFGWELWNEINAVNADRQVIYNWTVEMLPVVKSLFPNHLVMQSLGSFDRESSRDMYKLYMTIPSNDIAQVHRYLDPGASWIICRESMDTLAANSVTEIKEYISEKPILLSEVGAVEANHAGPSLLYESDSLGILLHDMLFAPFFSGAAGPGQSWHWDYYIEKHDLWWHYGRFAKAIKGINPIKERFQPAYFFLDNIRFYCLKGNKHTLIWCRDKNSNWKTELIEKAKPDMREISLDPKIFTNENINKIFLYDPWKNEISELISAVDTVKLRFLRSMIIRIEHAE